MQVLAVFHRFSAGSDVVVCAATGQTSLAAERAVLRFAGGADSLAGAASDAGLSGTPQPGCDVLVATPGRLVEHLDSTPGFTLRHLRFWVVDEADRLLSEAYQDWPRRVRESVFAAAPVIDARICPTTVRGMPGTSVAVLSATAGAGVIGGAAAGVADVPPAGLLASVLHPPAWRRSEEEHELRAAARAAALSPLPVPFRVIVCSATLTSNPRKLASLHLRAPTHFEAVADVSGGPAADAAGAAVAPPPDALPTLGERRAYDLPPTLLQAWAVCGAGDKPILLLYLLRLLEQTQAGRGGLLALVFAGSVETTHRLTRMLQLFGGLEGGGRIVEFSTTLSQSQRTAVLDAARAGAVSVLVSSDVAARGIDLPALPAVFHYDAPPRAKTYVHRVGRVARAGRPGASFVILKPEQVRHYQTRVVARTTGGARPPVKETVLGAAVHPYAPRFGRVVEALRDVLERERSGRLLPTRLLEPLLPLDDLPRAPRAAGEAWKAAPSSVAEEEEDAAAGAEEEADGEDGGSTDESSSVSTDLE